MLKCDSKFYAVDGVIIEKLKKQSVKWRNEKKTVVKDAFALANFEVVSSS